MRKIFTLLIYKAALTSSILFGAQASPWSSDYDAYQDQGVSHGDLYDTYQAKLHDAIRTNDEEEFNRCFERIINEFSDNQQRDIFNQKNLGQSPYPQAHYSSEEAAEDVVRSRHKCYLLRTCAPRNYKAIL